MFYSRTSNCWLPSLFALLLADKCHPWVNIWAWIKFSLTTILSTINVFDPYLNSIVWEMFLMRSKLISFVISGPQENWWASLGASLGGDPRYLEGGHLRNYRRKTAGVGGEKIFDYYQEDNRMQTRVKLTSFKTRPSLIAISFRCFKTAEIKSTISSLILI